MMNLYLGRWIGGDVVYRTWYFRASSLKAAQTEAAANPPRHVPVFAIQPVTSVELIANDVERFDDCNFELSAR